MGEPLSLALLPTLPMLPLLPILPVLPTLPFGSNSQSKEQIRCFQRLQYKKQTRKNIQNLLESKFDDGSTTSDSIETLKTTKKRTTTKKKRKKKKWMM